ncbi:hypothetical protein HKX48_009590 [Thoreauomyces humboldtii]|nr:hypothetical protein HKX48_009590 [Thoreauomyces humboldtii]
MSTDGQRVPTMIDLKSLAQLDPSKLSISTKTALLAALAAATVTATSIFAVQHFSKRNRIQRVKEEIAASLHSDSLSDFPHTSLAATTQQKIPPRTSEHLVREQLARNYAFLGEEGVSKVRGAFVVVVGLGGVGSHAAHMLARSGVERLRVVDFDQVSLSSLNRHAVATQADVGTAKSECLKEHFGRIAPQVVVEAMNVLFSAEAADDLLAGNPDYVLGEPSSGPLQLSMGLTAQCGRRQTASITSTQR